MKSSQPNHRSTAADSSSANFKPDLAVRVQRRMAFDHSAPVSGSLDDTAVIRGILIDSIKNCGLTRASIAEEMSFLLARTVTVAMLNAFTAESRDDRRWPADFDRAFCQATGNNELLRCRAELAGLHVIDSAQMELLELGKAFLQRTQADEKIALLQRRLAGRTL